jgi:hypothetical protein
MLARMGLGPIGLGIGSASKTGDSGQSRSGEQDLGTDHR